jgi:hypothetical protein
MRLIKRHIIFKLFCLYLLIIGSIFIIIKLVKMDCQNSSSISVSDKLEVVNEPHSSNNSANEWLIKKAIYYLNSIDKESEIAYKNVIELLTKNEATSTIIQQVRSTTSDKTLQWSLIYLLGDIMDKEACKWLSRYAVEPLPERGEGCEGPRDSEALLRTMAVHSLTKISSRYPETAEHLLKIISSHPDREILVEAVKGAVELGLKQKVVEILPKEDHWMIDIRKARIEEVHADPERANTKEVGFIPPKDKSEYTSPVINCSCTKGGTHHG